MITAPHVTPLSEDELVELRRRADTFFARYKSSAGWSYGWDDDDARRIYEDLERLIEVARRTNNANCRY
jgi:hypothetical protein